MVLWKYNENGSPDTSFGGGAGYVLFRHDGGSVSGISNASKADQGWTVNVDSNGRYVVQGYCKNSFGGYEVPIWRYLPEGTLDTSFGGKGYVILNHDTASSAGASASAKD